MKNLPETAQNYKALEEKLSIFGRVTLNADLAQGKRPRFHEGMTLDDAVLLTGLPKEEAAKRIQKMKNDTNPQYYAAVFLSEGVGELYKAETPLPVPTEKVQTAEILQFPLPFGDDTRAVSNQLARGSLFAAVKDRQFFQTYVVVGEVNGTTIEYQGEQLNQDDHDTFLQLIKMALHKEFGSEVFVPVNAVLRELGRSTHKEQRIQLFEQIGRIVRGTVRITTETGRYQGHLIDDCTTPLDQTNQPQHRRNLAYRLNPKFARLYTRAAYTLFNAQERLKLKGRGSELAKWLHTWIIGNAVQYPHKVETIRKMSGSCCDMKEFRRQLRRAFELLISQEIIAAWRIDPKDDLVYIERTPSDSQQKHLTKTKKPKPKT